MGMARGLADGLLRLCNGVWKDLDGDAVDIAEVVRCKDCIYCNQDAFGLWCFNDYEHNLQPNGYCSYGEKKDGDGNG